MKEETVIYVVFDGSYFGIGESADPDETVKEIIKFNPNVEILIEGGSYDDEISIHEIELLFINLIINKNEHMTWFLLDKDDFILLEDLMLN